MSKREFCYPEKCNRTKCFKCKEKNNCDSSTLRFVKNPSEQPSTANDSKAHNTWESKNENEENLIMHNNNVGVQTVNPDQKIDINEECVKQVDTKNQNTTKGKQTKSPLFKKNSKVNSISEKPEDKQIKSKEEDTDLVQTICPNQASNIYKEESLRHVDKKNQNIEKEKGKSTFFKKSPKRNSSNEESKNIQATNAKNEEDKFGNADLDNSEINKQTLCTTCNKLEEDKFRNNNIANDSQNSSSKNINRRKLKGSTEMKYMEQPNCSDENKSLSARSVNFNQEIDNKSMPDDKTNNKVTKEKQNKSSFFKRSVKADKSDMLNNSNDSKSAKYDKTEPTKLKEEHELSNADFLFDINNSQILNSTLKENSNENVQESKDCADICKNSSSIKNSKSEDGTESSLSSKTKSQPSHNQKMMTSDKLGEKRKKRTFDDTSETCRYSTCNNSSDLNTSKIDKKAILQHLSSFLITSFDNTKNVSESDFSSSDLELKKDFKKKSHYPEKSFESSTTSKKTAHLTPKKSCCSSPRCTTRDSEKILTIHSAFTEHESDSSSDYSSYDEDDPRIITFRAKFAKIKINLEKLWKHMNNGNFRVVYGPSFDESLISVIENFYDFLRRFGLLR